MLSSYLYKIFLRHMSMKTKSDDMKIQMACQLGEIIDTDRCFYISGVSITVIRE